MTVTDDEVKLVMKITSCDEHVYSTEELEIHKIRPGMKFLEYKALKPLLDENDHFQWNEDGILILEDGLPAVVREEFIPRKPDINERRIKKLRPKMTKEEYEELQPLLDEDGSPSWDINGLIILEDGLPCMRPEDRDEFLLPKPYVRFMEGETPDPVISDEMAERLAIAFIASEKENAKNKDENPYDEDGLLKMIKDIRDY